MIHEELGEKATLDDIPAPSGKSKKREKGKQKKHDKPIKERRKGEKRKGERSKTSKGIEDRKIDKDRKKAERKRKKGKGKGKDTKRDEESKRPLKKNKPKRTVSPEQIEVKEISVDKRQSGRKKFTCVLLVTSIIIVGGVFTALILTGVINFNTKTEATTPPPPTKTYTAPTTTAPNITIDVQMDVDHDWSVIRGNCGVPTYEPDLSRIVGGKQAERHSWPWQVALLQYIRFDETTSTMKALCGGTLVGPKYVITATHCFLNQKRDSASSVAAAYRVVVGSHMKGQATGGAKMVEIHSIHHHPKNNAATFTRLKQLLVYDLTVVILNEIIDPNIVTTVTGYACLPKPKVVPPVGKRCWATGWGATMGTGSSRSLKQVIQPIVSEFTCGKLYGSPGDLAVDAHLCGGPHKGYMGTCQGDSGGPLVCQYSDGSWVLHGATSFGPQPCGTNPSVWAQVSYHIDWICCFLDSYGPCSTIECPYM